MNLRHLRYFVAVGEELHFRRAAERMCIAQPALSIQIKALENYLGGQLILRNNHHVELTEAGLLFLVQARRILADIDDVTRMTRRALKGEVGFLRMAYSGNVAETGILTKVTRAFRERYPEVEISAIELDPASQVEALLKGTIQVSLMATCFKTLPLQLKATTLGMWPLRLVLPDNHPLLQKNSILIDDIRHEPFVVYAAHEGDDGTEAIRYVTGFTPVVSHRVTAAVMVTALVGAGLGLGLLPESMAISAMKKGVVFRALDGVEAQMDISLVTLSALREPVTLQFSEAINTVFSLK